MFIIDPLYTVPLLIGIGVALTLRSEKGLALEPRRADREHALSWLGRVGASHVYADRRDDPLKAQGIEADRVLVTPTAFNSILWRIVAVTPDAYLEGFHSLLDRDRDIAFDSFPRGAELDAAMSGNRYVGRVA